MTGLIVVFRMRSRLGLYGLFVSYKNCLIQPFITSLFVARFQYSFRADPSPTGFYATQFSETGVAIVTEPVQGLFILTHEI